MTKVFPPGSSPITGSLPGNQALHNAAPDAVLQAYGWRGAQTMPVTIGLINTTHLTFWPGQAPFAVLQKLHKIFAKEVNYDIEAITTHLSGYGIATPSLLLTQEGAPFVIHQDQVWRALSYVHGHAYSRMPTAEHAWSAAALIGQVHRSLDNLDYKFRFTRSGVHDTAAHLQRLTQAASGDKPSTMYVEVWTEAMRVAQAILKRKEWVGDFSSEPARNCHGDLKVSNILFASDLSPRAICLVDLDTFGRQRLAYELGDAMRSWCNMSGEDSEKPIFAQEIFDAALEGYSHGRGNRLTEHERDMIVAGLLTVCLELAARFCTDCFVDEYFGWDSAKYTSRREHNLVRAKGQLGLAEAVYAKIFAAR